MKPKIGILIILGLLMIGVKKMTHTPRGIRNNNPGNIRRTSIKWKGMKAVQRDALFLEFIAPEFGIRALCKVIMNYQKRYGINTIRGVIRRWAPSSENNTTAYIASVAAQSGIYADAPLDLTRRASLLPIIKAIIQHENGQQPYSISLLNKGLDMAGVA